MKTTCRNHCAFLCVCSKSDPNNTGISTACAHLHMHCCRMISIYFNSIQFNSTLHPYINVFDYAGLTHPNICQGHLLPFKAAMLDQPNAKHRWSDTVPRELVSIDTTELWDKLNPLPICSVYTCIDTSEGSYNMHSQVTMWLMWLARSKLWVQGKSLNSQLASCMPSLKHCWHLQVHAWLNESPMTVVQPSAWVHAPNPAFRPSPHVLPVCKVSVTQALIHFRWRMQPCSPCLC